jgi:holo-[acyl-carrier protein] synthase
MIIGTGIDIVEIEGIKASFEQSKRFITRVFTPDEIVYCEKNPYKYQHYAGRFAAKEAVMKALGTGWNNGISWKQIEIVNNDAGKPDIVFHKQAKLLVAQKNVKSVHLSISHANQYATALVILES